MDGYVLAQYEDNLANGMKVQGHCVLNYFDYKNFMKGLNAIEEGVEIHIGGNQSIYYEDGIVLRQKLCLSFLTKEQMDVLVQLNLTEGGFCRTILEQIMEQSIIEE